MPPRRRTQQQDPEPQAPAQILVPPGYMHESVLVQALNASAHNSTANAKAQEAFLSTMTDASKGLVQTMGELNKITQARESDHLDLMRKNGELQARLAAAENKNAEIEDRAKVRAAELEAKKLELQQKAQQMGQFLDVIKPFLATGGQVAAALFLAKMGIGPMGGPMGGAPSDGLPPPMVTSTPDAPSGPSTGPTIAESTAYVAQWRQMLCEVFAAMSDDTAAAVRARLMRLFELAQVSPEWAPLLERIKGDAGEERLRAFFMFTVAANQQGAAAVS